MGYLLLGSLFLAIGSMAATVREVQTLSMPVTMLQLLNFFFASWAVAKPGTVIEWAAMIVPFSSPFTMLARAARDEALLPHFLALAWQALADGLLDAALLVRYENNARPEALRWSDWTDGQMDKIHCCLKELERQGHQPRGGFDIGHLTVGCSLWYMDLRFPDMKWRERYPSLAEWIAPYMQRASMQMAWQLPA